MSVADEARAEAEAMLKPLAKRHRAKMSIGYVEESYVEYWAAVKVLADLLASRKPEYPDFPGHPLPNSTGASRRPEAAPTLSEVPDGVIPWEFFAETAGWVKPEAAPSDTDREARSDLVTRVRAEAAEYIRGWYKAAVSADVLIEEVAPIFEAGLLSRASQPVQVECPITERIFDLFDELTSAEVEALVPAYYKTGEDARAATGVAPAQPVQVEVTEFPFEHKGVTIEEDGGGLWVTQGGNNPHQWISPRARAALSAALGGGE